MKKKLLIIDHKAESRQKLKEALSGEYDILEAEDGIQGLEILNDEAHVTAILLELLLPKMNGLEFLQMIKSNPLHKNLAVIIVTSVGEPSDEVIALGIGADDYICKPFTTEVIAARIKNVLTNREVLSNSERRFGLQQNILDGSATAIYVVDAVNYNLFYANRAAIKLLNKKPNTSYTGKKCYEFFAGNKYPCSCCKLFIAHTEDNKAEIFNPFINKTVNVLINLIEWLGRPAYVLYMNDITEEIHARELAKERYEKELQRRYRVDLDFMAYLVINVTTGTVMEHDPHGFPVPTISPGQPASEFVERVLPTVIDFEQRQEFAKMLSLENLRRAFDEGRTVLTIDYRRYARNERYIMWARSTIQLMCDPQTDNLMAFLYTYDINENKMMQEIINTSVYYDYNMIAYINLYTGTAKLYAQRGSSFNRAVKEEFEYQKAVEEYAETFADAEVKEELLQKMSLDCIKERLENNQIYEFDADIVDECGDKKKRRLRYVNFDRGYGMALWTEVDITNIVESEKQQQQVLYHEIENLSRINDVKINYLCSISHELKIPLKNMFLRIKNATKNCDNSYVAGQLTEASAYLEQISAIINDIMDISNLENKKLKLANVQFTLSEMIEKLILMLRKRYPEKKETLKLEKQIFHDSVLGDFKVISKIMLNVLDNSFKYSDGETDISLFVYELPSANNEFGLYRFVIKDGGPGICQAQLENIFKPFHYYENNKNQNDSSGLGLAITKGLVDALGGDIKIVSQLGEGTTVTIDLQLQLANYNRLRQKSENTLEGAEQSIDGLKLLFVEDDPLQILVARRLLEQKGAVISVAGSEREAADLLEKMEFDCVVLDLQLNDDIDGVLHKLAQYVKRRTSVPIVGLSEMLDSETKHNFVEAGVIEILDKPVKFVKLLACIEQLCR